MATLVRSFLRSARAGLFSALALLSAATFAQAPAGNAYQTPAATQLQAQLRAIDGLQTVQVLEQSGVITLRGQVLELEDAKLAEEIAKKQNGIIAVRNELRQSPDVRSRLDMVWDEVRAKGISALFFLPLLLIAALVVWLAHRLGRFLAARKWLDIETGNPFLVQLVRRVVYLVCVLTGLLIALDLLGAKTLVGAVLGSAGVLGLALGFAFKDIAENYVAGLLLSLRRPFAPRDHVRIDNNEGKVAALTPRDTILMTLDGNDLRIPNATVFKAVILNYTRNPNRRLEFDMLIDSHNSIRATQEIALAAVAAVPGVLANPAPSWRVDAYGADGIKMRFLAWVDQRESDLNKVRTEAIRAVKIAFRDAQIQMPQNSMVLRADETLSNSLLPGHSSAASPASAAPGAPSTMPSAALAQGSVATAAPCPPERCEGEVIDTSVNSEIEHALTQQQRELGVDNLIATPPSSATARSAR